MFLFHSGSNPYLDGVKRMMDASQTRFSSFWLSFDIIYYLTPAGIEYKKSLKFLHDFTSNVVRERRDKIAGEGAGDVTYAGSRGADNKKRHLAFLDILLTAKVQYRVKGQGSRAVKGCCSKELQFPSSLRRFFLLFITIDHFLQLHIHCLGFNFTTLVTNVTTLVTNVTTLVTNVTILVTNVTTLEQRHNS